MDNAITSRCKFILKKLLVSTEPITIGQLEEIVGVSNKTISRDLDTIEYWLKPYKVKVVRKPNVGISLDIDSEKRTKINCLIDRINYCLPNTPQERQYYILMRLLQRDDYITTQQLADEMYVSKSTVNRDLPLVERWVKDHELEFLRKPNKGLKLDGSEKNLRAAIANILSETISNERLIAYIEDLNTYDKHKALEYYLSDETRDFFEDVNLKIIESSVRNLEKKLPYRFSDNAFIALVVHIAIAITRISKGYEITLPNKTMETLKEKKEYKLAMEMVEELEKKMNVKFPESEFGYITMHIMGGKIQKNILDNNDGLSDLNLDEEIISCCKKMIQEASNNLDIDLTKDKQLLMGLVLHVRSAINRLVYGLSIKNPFLEEIKKLYPTDFEVALYASKVIKGKYKVEMDEDEIAYIAMHFGAARERIFQNNAEKLQVILVCGSGLGSSQLLASRIRRTFPHIDIVDIVSVIDLKKVLKEKNIDVIITTIPLFINNLPTITVSPLLEQDDIEKIEDFLKRPTFNVQKYKISNRNKIKDLIEPELILPNKSFKTKEEAIKGLSKVLRENGYVKEGFYESVLRREKISSTALNSISIPHAFPGHVIDSKIVVCTLENPIDWDGEEVDIIFMLAVDNEKGKELHEIFDILYEIIEDQEVLEELRTMKDIENIINLLLEVE